MYSEYLDDKNSLFITKTAMVESYGWGTYKRSYISQRQIEKMKKNMRKVPLIQQHSDSYHKQEEKIADQLLKQATQGKHNTTLTTKINNQSTISQNTTHTRRQKLIHTISSLFS